jgi:hypothetical protein
MHSIQISKSPQDDADTASVFVISTDAGDIDLKIPVFLMCACVFWAAIANQYHLWSKHVDSIKFYRRKLKEKEEEEIS